MSTKTATMAAPSSVSQQTFPPSSTQAFPPSSTQSFPPPPTQTGPASSYDYGPPSDTFSRPQPGGYQIEQMPGPAFNAGPLNPGPPPQQQPPQQPMQPMQPFLSSGDNKLDLQGAKSGAESALREYMSLQRRRISTGEVGVDERLRVQAGVALADLRVLRKQVADIATAAESHRWRRWLIGGVLATFIPAVRAIFRRPREDPQSSNDTEYAFRKSKSLIGRILDSTRGRGGLASIAFFVFAVLYIFQNEVALRAARGVAKRLRRLSAKVEAGESVISEEDLSLLKGWRWRILMWQE